MPNAVMFISFRLVPGASVPDFLLATEKLNSEHMSKQKGYVSWKQLREGETWVDFIEWETMEDAGRAMEAGCETETAAAFFAFLDQESVETHLYSVEKSYT